MVLRSDLKEVPDSPPVGRSKVEGLRLCIQHESKRVSVSSEASRVQQSHFRVFTRGPMWFEGFCGKTSSCLKIRLKGRLR